MFANLYEKASEESVVVARKNSPSGRVKKRQKANRDPPAESSQPNGKRMSFDATPLPKRSRREGPSEAARALSTKLKDYSLQKRLNEALDLYLHESNDSIRDEHHACIVIDCSARAGCIEVRILEPSVTKRWTFSKQPTSNRILSS
jgi:hypothetical protein